MAQPEMIPVTNSGSGNSQEVGYDEPSQELWVRFTSGLYYYEGVPKAIYDGLLSASSFGAFLNQTVKGVYAYHRVG
jgi:hypothetical protein